VNNLAVTCDATRAFSASADGTTRVWRLASGRVIHEKPAPEDLVGLYAAPDAPLVVATTADGGAQLLDADTGNRLIHMTSQKVATVTAFAVAAQGACGVSGDVDGNATVWDLTAGEPTLRLHCQIGFITSIAVTPDARIAAVASRYGEVIVWDLTTGTRLAGLRHSTSVNALALTPDGRRVLVCGDELVVHDLTEVSTPAIARLVPNDWVTAVAVNPLMPTYALIGTAFGQVAYLRLPAPAPSRRSLRTTV
jgi:WD40 repeat protein